MPTVHGGGCMRTCHLCAVPAGVMLHGCDCFLERPLLAAFARHGIWRAAHRAPCEAGHVQAARNRAPPSTHAAHRPSACQMLLEIADSLAYLHRAGVLHGDMKLEVRGWFGRPGGEGGWQRGGPLSPRGIPRPGRSTAHWRAPLDARRPRGQAAPGLPSPAPFPCAGPAAVQNVLLKSDPLHCLGVTPKLAGAPGAALASALRGGGARLHGRLHKGQRRQRYRPVRPAAGRGPGSASFTP